MEIGGNSQPVRAVHVIPPDQEASKKVSLSKAPYGKLHTQELKMEFSNNGKIVRPDTEFPREFIAVKIKH